MPRFLSSVAVAGLLLLPAFAQAASEPWVYKKVDGKELKLLVDKPPGWSAGDKRPAIVFFFGESDKLIPVKVATDFATAMKKAGSRCDTHLYPGAGHGFFNAAPYYPQTVSESDKFLASLGWLKGVPTLQAAR